MSHSLTYCAIGLGPSNLSLGALAQEEGIEGVHLERHSEFRWHPGMQMENATIQVPMLKDLVSAVRPTSRFSFTNFLVEQGRFYEHLNCGFERILRTEYEQYLSWAASNLNSVIFDAEVIDVTFDGKDFLTTTKNQAWRSRHLVLGVGQEPRVPRWCPPLPNSRVVHSSTYMQVDPRKLEGAVVVIGGGQSGAEIVFDLACRAKPPTSIEWITRRSALHPLDESAFANDLFGPDALHDFYNQSDQTRRDLLNEQKLASDGINASLLKQIYQHLYRLKYLNLDGPEVSIHASAEAQSLITRGEKAELTYSTKGTSTALEADFIVLATGYKQALPSFLGGIMPLLHIGASGIQVAEDFSLEWEGPRDQKIFIQNGAAHHFGVAEPNLSLMPFRSSSILKVMKELSDE